MSDAFFNSPILNSPYAEPDRHWELDDQGQPTAVIVSRRRQSALVSPIPKAKKVRGKAVQTDFLDDETGQEYNPVEVINGIRSAVPRSLAQDRRFWAQLEAANAPSNPSLIRFALKIATRSDDGGHLSADQRLVAKPAELQRLAVL